MMNRKQKENVKIHFTDDPPCGKRVTTENEKYFKHTEQASDITCKACAEIVNDPRRKYPVFLSGDTHQNFWMRVDIREKDECWEWIGQRMSKGYGTYFFQHARILSHRYAYASTYGEFPHEDLACHDCDNPPCCNPSHLFLGDRSANARDMVSKGRHNKNGLKGERHPQSKLTEVEVLEIRKKYVIGNGKILAKEYNINDSIIYDIIARKLWKHI